MITRPSFSRPLGSYLDRPVRAPGETSSPGSAIPTQLFLGFILIFGICSWLIPGNEDPGSGSTLVTVVWFASYLVASRIIYLYRSEASRLFRLSGPAIALMALAALSTIWSAHPEMTARRVVELFGTYAIALSFVLALDLNDLVRTSSAVLAALGIASGLAIALAPGIAAGPDGWQGVFPHKNSLGDGMLLCMIGTAVAMPRLKGLYRFLLLAAVPVDFALFAASKAAGAYVCGLALILFMPTMLSARAKWLKPSGVLLVGAIVTIAAAAGVLITGFDFNDALGLLGKDSTLTGRADVWRLVIDAISAKPITGYGYGVFWGSDGPAANLVYPGIDNGWEPESAHNGFLEVAVNLGAVGELALLAFGVLAFRRAYTFFRMTPGISSIWPLCVLLSSVVYNLSEATFNFYNSIDWVLFLVAFLYSARAIPPSGGPKRVTR